MKGRKIYPQSKATSHNVMLMNKGVFLSGVRGGVMYRGVIHNISLGTVVLTIHHRETDRLLDEIAYSNIDQLTSIWDILDRRVLIEKTGHCI